MGDPRTGMAWRARVGLRSGACIFDAATYVTFRQLARRRIILLGVTMPRLPAGVAALQVLP